MAHAKLSPSASARWTTCTASVKAIEALPAELRDGKSSTYAQAGTAMHSVAEMCLVNGKLARSYVGVLVDGITITTEQADIAQAFVDFVKAQPGMQFYEVRVRFADDCFGTADAVSITDDGHAYISDLKTGSGVYVDAADNNQLLIYAEAVCRDFGLIWPIKKVTMAIVQPTLNNFSSVTMTRKQLATKVKKTDKAIKQIKAGKTKFIPSERACRWCPAASTCEALQNIATKAAATDFGNPETESPENLAALMDLVPLLKTYVKIVEGRLRDVTLSGGHVPGWKVVEGRRTRTWKDEQELVASLREWGYDENLFTKTSVMSPAQLDKALPSIKEDIQPLVMWKDGGPTVAPETDKRPALAMGAVNDFAKVSGTLSA